MSDIIALETAEMAVKDFSNMEQLDSILESLATMPDEAYSEIANNAEKAMLRQLTFLGITFDPQENEVVEGELPSIEMNTERRNGALALLEFYKSDAMSDFINNGDRYLKTIFQRLGAEKVDELIAWNRERIPTHEKFIGIVAQRLEQLVAA